MTNNHNEGNNQLNNPFPTTIKTSESPITNHQSPINNHHQSPLGYVGLLGILALSYFFIATTKFNQYTRAHTHAHTCTHTHTCTRAHT